MDNSIKIPGTLKVKSATGKYGMFNYAYLDTSIGEFSVKSALIEQLTVGLYSGIFTILKIHLEHFKFSNGTGTKLAIKLGETENLRRIDQQLNDDKPNVNLPEVDPIDEESKDNTAVNIPAQKPADASLPPKKLTGESSSPTPEKPNLKPFRPLSKDEKDQNDRLLFGENWPLGEIVKIDTTLERKIQRQQIARLGELGYEHITEKQHFAKKNMH